MSKRKFTYLGRDVEGGDVFHSTDGKVHVHAAPAPSGKPVPLGRELACITPENDGLYTIESVTGEAAGPAQVATDAYRAGWDRVFGDPSSVN